MDIWYLFKNSKGFAPSLSPSCTTMFLWRPGMNPLCPPSPAITLTKVPILYEACGLQTSQGPTNPSCLTVFLHLYPKGCWSFTGMDCLPKLCPDSFTIHFHLVVTYQRFPICLAVSDSKHKVPFGVTARYVAFTDAPDALLAPTVQALSPAVCGLARCTATLALVHVWGTLFQGGFHCFACTNLLHSLWPV